MRNKVANEILNTPNISRSSVTSLTRERRQNTWSTPKARDFLPRPIDKQSVPEILQTPQHKLIQKHRSSLNFPDSQSEITHQDFLYSNNPSASVVRYKSNFGAFPDQILTAHPQPENEDNFQLPHVKINLFDLITSSAKKISSSTPFILNQSRLELTDSASPVKQEIFVPPSPIKDENGYASSQFYENHESFTDLKIIASNYGQTTKDWNTPEDDYFANFDQTLNIKVPIIMIKSAKSAYPVRMHYPMSPDGGSRKGN